MCPRAASPSSSARDRTGRRHPTEVQSIVGQPRSPRDIQSWTIPRSIPRGSRQRYGDRRSAGAHEPRYVAPTVGSSSASSSRISWRDSRADTRACSRRRGHRLDHAVSRRAHDRPSAEHLGLLGGQPDAARIRHDGALLPVDFCVNVTLNRRREITGFYCGEVIAAHEAGCAFSRRTAMVAVRAARPNRDHDQQRLSARPEPVSGGQGHVGGGADRRAGGYIATAARCNDGFPEHGNFKRLLFDHDSPRALLDTIMSPGFSMYDQWEAQLLAGVLLKARVGLYSELPPENVRPRPPRADRRSRRRSFRGVAAGRPPTHRSPFFPKDR